MKTYEEIYGLEKEAGLPQLIGRGLMNVARKGQQFFGLPTAKSVGRGAVDFGGRLKTKFMKGGIGDKLAIGFGVGTLAMAVPGTRQLTQVTVGNLPGGGIATSLFDPYHSAFQPRAAGSAPKDIVARTGAVPMYKTRRSPVLERRLPPMERTASSKEVSVFDKKELERALKVKKGLEKTSAAKGMKRIIEKNASAPQSFARQAALYSLAGIGVGAGAPAALYGIGKGIKYLQRGSLNRDYKKVLKEDPSLHKMESEHGATSKELYKVLHRTSPYVAREPVVAAKVLKNMMLTPSLTPQTFSDVLKLEKLYQDTEMPFFNQGGHGMKPGDLTPGG